MALLTLWLTATPGQAQVCRVTLPLGPGNDLGTSTAIQADGKIVMVGYSSNGTDDQFVVVRYNPNFTLDSTFDRDGIVTTNLGPGEDRAEAMLIQPDGKIVVAGHRNNGGVNNDFAIVRYNPNGSLDTTFNPGGASGGPPNLPGIVTSAITAGDDQIEGIALQADLKIVVSGWTQRATTDYVVARYSASGILDTAGFNAPTGYRISANGATNDAANAVAVTSTGKIVIAGWSNSGLSDDFAAARFTAAGALDAGFGGTGEVLFDFAGNRRDHAITLVTQPGLAGAPDFGEDKLTLTGEVRAASAFDMFGLMRINGNGTLDGGFGAGGKASTDFDPARHDAAYGIARQPGPGNEIVLGGWAFWTGAGTTVDFALARFTSAGVLDTTTFNPPTGQVTTNFPANNNDWIDAIALQSDGKIVAAGYSDNGTNSDLALARYTSSGALDTSCAVPVNYRSIGTAANYTTGTVTATTGSAIVTGSGTAWLTNNRGRGDRIRIDGIDHVVLAVLSNTELRMTTPFLGATGSGKAYTLARQFTTLTAWETCIDGNPCAFFPVASASLIADNRSEVGIAYKESALGKVDINGSLTDANHTITLTADPGNRHLGTAGAGVIVDGAAASIANVLVQDDYVTVEWLEIKGGLDEGIEFQSLSLSPGPGNKCVVRNLLIHNTTKDGILIDDATATVDVYNNIVYATAGSSTAGIWVGTALTSGAVRLFNNTVYGNTRGIVAAGSNPGITLRNNVALANPSGDYNVANRNAASSNNLASDASGTTHSPAGGGLNNVTATASPTVCGSGNCVGFSNLTAGSENLHLIATSYTNRAVDTGANLDTLIPAFDIDTQVRPAGAAWDGGADELGATTAVTLQSFSASPVDSGVDLSWVTASELSNLGFHLYRSQSQTGPWHRITASLIPGLGSSPTGASYSWRDEGLVNGVRYFYRLEDVDASSVSTFHGPIGAEPQAGAGGSGEDPGGDASDPGEVTGSRGGSAKGGVGPPWSCPEPVLRAYASAVGADAVTPSLRCTRHGDPEATALELLSHDGREATLELRTGGFYALHDGSGTVRVFVPGFDFAQREQAAALPLRRALVEAVVGRRVELGGVRAVDIVGYRGLEPSSLGQAEMQLSWDGTVRAVRRGLREPVVRQRAKREERRRVASSASSGEWVKLLPSVFQGETKSAVVELAPLRYEARRQELVLAKRLRVRLLFTGREPLESGRGSRGRSPRQEEPEVAGEVLARLYTASVGLHAVSFEELFPGRTRGFAATELRLERQGSPIGFHLEPAASSFGPGGRLYFHVDRVAGSTAFSGELAYELRHAREGVVMPLAGAAPVSAPIASDSQATRTFETNRFYQPGLLAAPDPWLWEALVSGATRVVSFVLTGVVASGTAELAVDLQGASQSAQAEDHHLSVSLNGTFVGEARFAGKQPYRIELSLPASLLREGPNELQLTNVGDTGVTSLVFLDRFQLAHPQWSSTTGGRFEGVWAESGSAAVSGLGGAAALVELAAEGAAASAGTPRWLTGARLSGGELRFEALAGRRYLAVSAEAVLRPRVAAVAASSLRAATNQADYLLIAPRAFLEAAEPLLARRRDQGLVSRAVPFEEITDEFGHGERSGEAIRSFLGYAYHSWRRPSPRYVVLLGDSSYDPQGFIASSPPAPLPALWTKTSYLWTVSDPLLGAVNGEDALPDLAIGRLPAGTLQQAQALVAKLLAWEESGQGLSGPAALVADDPDIGGDFEADVEDIRASFLSGRATRTIKLRELGPLTRPAIQQALDSGLGQLHYVGHGGAAVWASENVWNSSDAASLLAQSSQPLLVTMNCLNGYFVAPAFDSLSESLLKAEGRGAIAAFSPSGLSLDGPAHAYHRALVAELVSGRHQRLGDALMAAQQDYARTGLMPELVSVYHLLGDPGMMLDR